MKTPGADRKQIAVVASTLGFVLASRGVGILRELVISIGFGLSRATDSFYQLSAGGTYIQTYITGPFSTAYIAWANKPGAPRESEHLAFIGRFVILASGLCSLLYSALMLAIALHRGSGADAENFALSALIMAPTCLLVGIMSLGAAVQNARGQFAGAQKLLFINNALFVVLLAIGATVGGHTSIFLTGAYLVASLVSATIAFRALGPLNLRRTQPWSKLPLELQRSLRTELAPTLMYASAETGGFLITQAIVLTLASLSGVGAASGAALSARICLTANGLIVNPLSNMMMVHLARANRHQRAFALRAVIATLGGLGAVALMLTLFRGELTGALRAHGRFSEANAHLLASLIPDYSLWLVAQGASMVIARLCFTLGRARLFTALTLAGYGLANLARYFTWRIDGFPDAIGVGALFELTASLSAVVVLLKGMADAPDPPAVDLAAQ